MAAASTQPATRAPRLTDALLRTQPDSRLVALAREGSKPAFEEIVRRHGTSLTAFARSLAPAALAQDIVQDSMLKAYVALQGGDSPELLRAWLFRIVRNTAIDSSRGRREHEQLDESIDGVEQPPQAAARHERIASLVTALKGLPRPQREAIVKRELEGRGHDEIATALGTTPGAVRQLIYRARSSLRETAGALVPMPLLRTLLLGDGGGVLAGVTGLGAAGALKLTAAALVTTGAVVAGIGLGSTERDGGTAAAAGTGAPGAEQFASREVPGNSSDPGAARGERGGGAGPAERGEPPAGSSTPSPAAERDEDARGHEGDGGEEHEGSEHGSGHSDDSDDEHEVDAAEHEDHADEPDGGDEDEPSQEQDEPEREGGDPEDP